MSERVYTTVDLARVCKVSLRTVIRWVDEGKLASFRTPGGHRRVREEDLLKFLDRYQIPFSIQPKGLVKKILVIEERNVLEGLLKQILRRSSDKVEVVAARDLFELAVRVGLSRPDVVVVGKVPRGQELAAFCRSLRRLPETKRTKVIVLVSRISAEEREDLLASGVQAVIERPYTVDDLRPHLLKILEPSPARSN